MRRGTTPTLTFVFPFLIDGAIKDLRVNFEQKEETKVERTLEECEVDGKNLLVKLTQEETLSFDTDELVKMQVKFIDFDGNVSASQIIQKSCFEILNEEIL